MLNHKKIKLIIILFGLVSLGFNTDKKAGVTYCESPLANGTLKLQVKNDSLKYICEDIKVKNGLFKACDSNTLISYDFFITRHIIDSNWLVNPIKINDFFPQDGGGMSKLKWRTFQYKKSYHYKEDFISNQQKSGVTYRHHESKKNFINYVMANPNEKPYFNESKFQHQYEWEESIKGKYESFYDDGIKRFLHKYLVNRFISLDKKINAKGQQSNCDISLSGIIESFYKSGKKRELVIYNDIYITEKTLKKKRIIIKSERIGERKTYYETGKLLSSGNINYKGYNGEVIYFSVKKSILKTANYKDGVLHGKFKEFHEGNSIKTKGQYTFGNKSGKWLYFDEFGKKTSTILF